MSACSGDASKKYDGLRTTNWSSGALLATSTAADRPGAAAGPAGPLPGRGDRARVAGQHGDVERADVDAELERVGRDDAAHRRRRAAPSRSRAAGSAGSRPGSRGSRPSAPGSPSRRVLQVARQDLGDEPALREDDDLQAAVAGTRARRAASRCDVRPADAELPVDDRRVHEDEELLAARRAALVDELERPLGQPLGQLARVGDRRRRADERRVASRSAGRCGAAAAARWPGGCRRRRGRRAARR